MTTESLEDLFDYLDADARMMRRPVLFHAWANPPEDCIIAPVLAVHYRRDKLGYRLGDPDKGELLNGTMYLSNNSTARRLFQRYIELDIENPSVWEQKNLQQAIEDMPEVHVYNMGTLDEAVIAHTQASRRKKQVIGR